ncbi:MAG: hypothetical protein KatS3mg019_0492 [Fimbriimonadales bacterium]|nr:MAG: hypothetical protein KatS3mg019_0492 [Fimbriimonadales bacterium]
MSKHDNPILRYHLFGLILNRWKRQPVLYLTVAVGIALVYVLIYQIFHSYGSSIDSVLNLCVLVVCFAAPLMAYNLFSLEYERHTWESLALTRLSAKEILWGKWGAAVVRVGALTLLFVPMLMTRGTVSIQSFTSPAPATEFNAYVFFASLALLLSWGMLLSSLGMWLSFKLKRTLSTASILYAGQVFVLILLPMLNAIFSGGDSRFYYDRLSTVSNFWEGLIWWGSTLMSNDSVFVLNPFFVATELGGMGMGWRAEPYLVGWGYVQSVIYFALSLLFAGLTYRGLKIAWRK